MHTSLTPSIISRLLRSVAALAAITAAAGAQAGGVSWSVNIDAPLLPVGRVVTAVSNVPAPVAVYRSAPVVVQPPDYYYSPPVVVHQPRPVYGAPYPVVYNPPPRVVVVPQPRPWGPAWGWHHHHHGRDWREARADWDRWDGGGRVLVDPRDGRGGRDGGRDGWRDGGRDGGREGGRDRGGDGGQNGRWEGRFGH